MTKITKGGFSVEEIVEQVVANARLSGYDLDEETIEVVRKTASGEMTREQGVEWRRKRLVEALARDRACKG